MILVGDENGPKKKKMGFNCIRTDMMDTREYLYIEEQIYYS